MVIQENKNTDYRDVVIWMAGIILPIYWKKVMSEKICQNSAQGQGLW